MPVVGTNLGGAPTVKQVQAASGALNPAQGDPTGETSKAFVMLGMPHVFVHCFQADTGLAPATITVALQGCVRPNVAGGGAAAKVREAWVTLATVVLVPHVDAVVIPLFFFPGMKVRLQMVASDAGTVGNTEPVNYIIGASA